MAYLQNGQGAAGGGSGTVTNVTSPNTSIVVTNGTTVPVLTVGTADKLFTNSAPVAAVAMNSQKITGLAVATAATDVPTFSQIPDGSNGQVSMISPSSNMPWVGIASGFTLNKVFCSRFVPKKNFTITNIFFRIITTGTGNTDVGILDATGSRLASSGSTAGKKGSANSMQSIALSSPLNVTAGTVYYAAIESDVSDGQFAAASYAGGLELWFGSTVGTVEAYLLTTTFPIPTTVALGFTSSAQGPVLSFT